MNIKYYRLEDREYYGAIIRTSDGAEYIYIPTKGWTIIAILSEYFASYDDNMRYELYSELAEQEALELVKRIENFDTDLPTRYFRVAEPYKEPFLTCVRGGAHFEYTSKQGWLHRQELSDVFFPYEKHPKYEVRGEIAEQEVSAVIKEFESRSLL